ncbi:interleukin-1 receptor accessory protein isoform X1 [Acipenser oxyrinchus oxyrinchus]|uniref:Interleukin-1 receptor accessory protein isoform X1 n=1 Tax=Acipenser oxyrinchus oxyrinchus TaxID=40147 RepID=A0AAD8DG51_ACIOX|nr:interleukin-1 receptor accessory protein isoform X1 [Acipenser oxyrinchus oxyrinchus]
MLPLHLHRVSSVLVLCVLCAGASTGSSSLTAGLTAPCSADSCYDLGTCKTMQVYEGETGRLSCPLFSNPTKYNYSTAQEAGLTLVWYWTRQNQDLEEPINFLLKDHWISKEMDMLWFRPTSVNDSGAYICMLRNNTHCYKIAVPLIVLQKDPGSCVSSHVQPDCIMIPLEGDGELSCPDIEGYYPTQERPPISWYRNCTPVESYSEKQVKYNKIYFNIMRQIFAGNYTCIVNYTVNGTTSTLTRTVFVKVVGSPTMQRKPFIHNPVNQSEIIVTLGALTKLSCQVFFTFVMNSETEVWWTIDRKREETFTDPRVEIYTSVESTELEDKTITKTLQIKEFSLQDVKRNYTCFARNALGEVSRQAILTLTTPVPIVELACGLGVTLLLMISLFIVCYVYWLELVLLYRAHFGTDESATDGKDYDIYISYARHAEEEEFVLLILRSVLENEFGYKVCIFDRDSLPGGTITDETLSFIRRSRRIIVVLSPNYLLKGSQTLLELKAGINNMAQSGSNQNTGDLKIIVINYKPAGSPCVELLQLKQTAFIKWKGKKSKSPQSKFWKALRLALPLRTLAAGVRLIDSSSSHSDISVDRRPAMTGVGQEFEAERRIEASSTKSRRGASPCMSCRVCVTYRDNEKVVHCLETHSHLSTTKNYGTEIRWTHVRPKLDLQQHGAPAHRCTQPCSPACLIQSKRQLCSLAGRPEQPW